MAPFYIKGAKNMVQHFCYTLILYQSMFSLSNPPARSLQVGGFQIDRDAWGISVNTNYILSTKTSF